MVYPASHQPGGECAGDGARPVAASLIYSEQPEPYSFVDCVCGQQSAAFHVEDGSGYQFWWKCLPTNNSRNPQVASRLIEPLIRLNVMMPNVMRAALEQLKGLVSLSGDLYEKITKKHWLDK